MMTTWVLLVDDSIARIYLATENGKEIKLTQHIDNIQSRMENIEVVVDDSGLYHIRESTHGTPDASTNARQINQEQLACEVSEFLETNYRNKKFNSLIIFSDTDFNLHFSRHVSPELKQKARIIIKKHEFVSGINLPVTITKDLIS